MKAPLLILGATTPIGLGVVQAAIEGGRPVIAVSHDEAALAQLAGAYPSADLQLLPASLKDDTGAAELARALHDLDRPLGGVVAALCNGTERGRLLDQPVARLRETFDDILVPHLAAARHLLPLLAESGRSGGYVLIDGPGGEHPWAGYSHRSVGAAALRMLARVLHDEARVLPVRVQMLSVESPVRTDANAAQACSQWPSAVSIGRRALAMIDRRDSEGAAPLVHCSSGCSDSDAADAAHIATTPLAAAIRDATHGASKADIADSLLTSRCLQDVRTLLDTFKFTVPSKEDFPHDQS
jgi:NAD(P)-dependent dehydrogenase (short-subunit alcohol dehydrogenase family)